MLAGVDSPQEAAGGLPAANSRFLVKVDCQGIGAEFGKVAVMRVYEVPEVCGGLCEMLGCGQMHESLVSGLARCRRAVAPEPSP
jgi:hypothetical protein